VLSAVVEVAAELRGHQIHGARFNALQPQRCLRICLANCIIGPAMLALVALVLVRVHGSLRVWVDTCAGGSMAMAASMTPAELVAWACSIPEVDLDDAREAIGVGCGALVPGSSPPRLVGTNATVRASARGLPGLVCGERPSDGFVESGGVLPSADDVHASALWTAVLLLVAVAVSSGVAVVSL